MKKNTNRSHSDHEEEEFELFDDFDYNFESQKTMSKFQLRNVQGNGNRNEKDNVIVNEKSRLLPKQLYKSKSKFKRGITLFTICINLIKTAIGAGILTLPYTFRLGGVILSSCFFIIISLLAFYTLHLLGITSELGIYSYTEIGKNVFKSKIIGVIFELCNFFNSYGAVVGYTVFVSEYSANLLNVWLAVEAKGIFKVLLSEGFVGFVLMVVLMLPISLLKKLSFLSFTSFLSLIAVMFVVLVVIIRVFQLGIKPFEELTMVNTEYREIIAAAPLIIFSFGNHFSLLPLLKEVEDYKFSRTKKTLISLTSTIFISLLYFTFCLLGYLLFGNGVKDNILMSFDDHNVLGQIAKIFLTFVISMTYPIYVFSCRDSLLNIFCSKCKNVSFFTWVIITVLICVSGWLLAVLVPIVSVVIGLTGATSYSIVCYIIPLCASIKTDKRIFCRVINGIIIIFITILSILSTVGIVWDYIEETFYEKDI